MDTGELVVPGGDAELYEELATEKWGEPPDGGGFVGRCRFVSSMDGVGGGKYSAAGPDHPNVPAVGELLSLWPEAEEGFGSFVTAFLPLTHPNYGPDTTARGCASGHRHGHPEPGDRGVFVTVYDEHGCYEGLLHEWGHLRLRAAGVGMTEHDGWLLDNDAGSLFVSPVRKDKKRPMPAVLQAFYSWLMLTEGGVRAARAEPALEETFAKTLRVNAPKIEEGALTVREHAEWTPEGEAFGEELLAWADRLVEDAWGLVGRGEREPAIWEHREWVKQQPVSESPLHD